MASRFMGGATLVIASCIIVAVYLSFAVQRKPADLRAPATTTDTRQSQEGTDEQPVDTDSLTYYQVPQSHPRLITIDALGVKARILPMGVNADGSMQAPTNIYDTGWYTKSAEPGSEGAMVIDGHVNGPSKPGVFYYLHQLKKEDVITIETGANKELTYRVTQLETVPATQLDMSKVFSVMNNHKEGLTLITCAGNFNQVTQSYSDRTIVYAVRS